jgi:hypothetical protein
MDVQRSFPETKRDKVARLLALQNAERISMVKGVLADTMPPLHVWPSDILERFMRKRCDHGDRLQLVYFCMANRMTPNTFAKWCMAQKGVLTYDTSAKDLAQMIRAWAKGDFALIDVRWMPFNWMGHTLEEALMLLNFKYPTTTCEPPSFVRETETVRVNVNGVDSFYVSPGSAYAEDAAKMLDDFAKRLPREPPAFLRCKEEPVKFTTVPKAGLPRPIATQPAAKKSKLNPA